MFGLLTKIESRERSRFVFENKTLSPAHGGVCGKVKVPLPFGDIVFQFENQHLERLRSEIPIWTLIGKKQRWNSYRSLKNSRFFCKPIENVRTKSNRIKKSVWEKVKEVNLRKKLQGVSH